MMGPKCSRQGRIPAAKHWVENWWIYHSAEDRWEDLGPDTASIRLRYHSWSADGRSVYGLSVDRRTIERFTVPTRRLETVADLGTVDLASPPLGPCMGLDHRDRPLVISSAGVEDLHVVEWEAR